MEFTIRPAKREDCPAMLELIRELAIYERAPGEVTVSLEHFEESGFGEKPVWWAYVACAPIRQEAAEQAAERVQSSAVQDPVLTSIMEEAPKESSLSGETLEVGDVTDELPVPPVIQLDEPVEFSVPEPVLEALPLMQEGLPCDQVIGFALYYMRYSTWKGQRMYLEDLLVTESWRCRGVGTALMDTLIGVAKAERLHGISWQVLEWNEAAIRFYQRYSARFDKEWVNVAIDV
jgi:GNAT superfamily N-acetyltransferase